MADDTDESEKTEDPTQKRLDDALEKGNVAKSQEVNTWFVLAAVTLVVALMADKIGSDLTVLLGGFLEKIHDIPIDSGGLKDLTMNLSFNVLMILAMPFAALILAAIAGNMVQHKLVFSVEPIKPKLSKVSPLQGLKRLFGLTSLVNFAKGLAKLGIIGTAMFLIAWPDRDIMAGLITFDPAEILPATKAISLKMLIGAVALLAIIAALDYSYQRHTWYKKQRMTQKEVKDEFKQQEGDPHVRARIRQIRMERGRQRMMADVPDASVVITNPTHYAVALKYESGMPAPICVAKGVDNIALKIREVATEHDVPIVENPPLARALYAGMEIEQEIPEEHFKAVAKVISYVMQLKSKASRWR